MAYICMLRRKKKLDELFTFIFLLYKKLFPSNSGGRNRSQTLREKIRISDALRMKFIN